MNGKTRSFVMMLAAALLLGCAACGGAGAGEQADTVAVGEKFTAPYQVESGTMHFTVNRAEISDNMRQLGADPNSMAQYDNFVIRYDGNGTKRTLYYPDYVDLETGQLADGLAFVLVDITAENTDAVSNITGDGSGLFDSEYMFLPSAFYLCDLAQKDTKDGKEQSTYMTMSEKWYSAQQEGYMYELPPGESKTFQIGFVVGRADGDYSSLCLTTASQVDKRALRSPDVVLVDLGLGACG